MRTASPCGLRTAANSSRDPPRESQAGDVNGKSVGRVETEPRFHELQWADGGRGPEALPKTDHQTQRADIERIHERVLAEGVVDHDTTAPRVRAFTAGHQTHHARRISTCRQRAFWRVAFASLRSRRGPRHRGARARPQNEPDNPRRGVCTRIVYPRPLVGAPDEECAVSTSA